MNRDLYDLVRLIHSAVIEHDEGVQQIADHRRRQHWQTTTTTPLFTEDSR